MDIIGLTTMRKSKSLVNMIVNSLACEEKALAIKLINAGTAKNIIIHRHIVVITVKFVTMLKKDFSSPLFLRLINRGIKTELIKTAKESQIIVGIRRDKKYESAFQLVPNAFAIRTSVKKFSNCPIKVAIITKFIILNIL
jgi:hypothetical protein